MFTRIRRAHYLFTASLFGLLGFHVGVWAVQLAPLSAGLHLDPAALGATLTVAAAAGLVTLFAGGRLADRVGRRPVLVIGFAGTGTAVTAPDAAGAIGGLLLVGFAIAPVVPATLSLAGRSAPGRSGQAVATTTAAGYGAFILSPLTIGLIAQATSLRLALALLVLTSLGIAGLATRWPRSG